MTTEHVPDFTVAGLEGAAPDGSAEVTRFGGQADLAGVQALRLSVCVGASYNPQTQQICFQIPIYGNFCVRLPISIPVGASLKVCAQTCGSIIPTGLKATIYVNGNVVKTIVLFGVC